MDGFEQKKLSKELIVFAEKPATGEERAVAIILQKFISAYNQNNILEISGFFSSDALVKGIATRGAFINKNDYLLLLRNNLRNIKLLTLRNAIIRINNDYTKVYGLMTIQSVDGKIGQSDIFFKLLKKEERWLISQIIVQDPSWL